MTRAIDSHSDGLDFQLEWADNIAVDLLARFEKIKIRQQTKMEARAQNPGQNELAAYNIRVVEQSLVDFFGVEELPSVPASLHAFIATEDRSNATDDETHKLLHHLDLAHTPKDGQEAAVDVFVQQLLSRLGYTESRRIIMIGQALPLLVCGSNCSAQTDVCILVSCPFHKTNQMG
ncbi:hypothetical protein GGX14DRAFT_564293 [Mycena pura]|uniref:Uncharacterized protein n=1 Tax=Mycena pura TaxID=153505 RepID=A0AAD6YBW1_9AGAR|nr:hypothetical protein GGX14DRAFT_564293 [Mycena pura]